MISLTSLLSRVFIILVVFVGFTKEGFAAPGDRGKGRDGGSGKEHPAMHEALDALRRAKTSAKKMEDLNAAYHRLKQGKQNKEGYRVRAMGLVQKAMDELQAKRHIEADKLIDQAITVVEKAVVASPDRR